MKFLVLASLLFTATQFAATPSLALPDGGIFCENNDHTSDDYMGVQIRDGVVTFEFWESSFDPIKATVAGVNTFAIVEEKVKASGEGNEWIFIFSAFLVYNSQTNELSITSVEIDDGDQRNPRTNVLPCRIGSSDL